MTPYCGTVAKKGAALQQRLLGLKSAVMCNSHLLASASGGGLRHRRPSSVTALIRGHQTPEFRGLLTAFVSLWLEFQEKQVGSSPDNLLFFKWTQSAVLQVDTRSGRRAWAGEHAPFGSAELHQV